MKFVVHGLHITKM